MSAVRDLLPRADALSEEAWGRRHLLLQWVLLLHIPVLFGVGVARGKGIADVATVLAVPFVCLLLGRFMPSRRLAACFVAAGLVACALALVGLTDGSTEAHFHFFVLVGFIALYQDWVVFVTGIGLITTAHLLGAALRPRSFFDHPTAQHHPWAWSLIHIAAVLAEGAGIVLFWQATEREQRLAFTLRTRMSHAELDRRRSTSHLLVNLARRNHHLLHRQLELLNQLEHQQSDPDALADLFRLEHLSTRIRRNAENLLVLSGEAPPRTWGRPVPLVDVVRAAIAEIERLERVDFAIDEGLAVSGRAVADVTHLLAELIENSVHFSPPGVGVMLRSRPNVPTGGQVVTIEDWGVGMGAEDLAEANWMLAEPRDVDLSASPSVGLHVVARLAARYGIAVSVSATPGGGVTAVVRMPADLFADAVRPLELAAPPAWVPAEPPQVPPYPGAPSPGAPSPGAPSPGAPSPGAPSPGAPSPGAPSPGAPSRGAPSPGAQSPAQPDKAPWTEPAWPHSGLAAAAVLPVTGYRLPRDVVDFAVAARPAPPGPPAATVWTSPPPPNQDTWHSWWSLRNVDTPEAAAADTPDNAHSPTEKPAAQSEAPGADARVGTTAQAPPPPTPQETAQPETAPRPPEPGQPTTTRTGSGPAEAAAQAPPPRTPQETAHPDTASQAPEPGQPVTARTAGAQGVAGAAAAGPPVTARSAGAQGTAGGAGEAETPGTSESVDGDRADEESA